ncbi:GNAT family N-acetyltransferase [Roseovarius faecimaris]|uniref:GNAT family N-acetyltransferase n=1 Tax=Roseovarius faecimaris TaxID=2494550 RepID=A0A6I6IRR6_9RHOB|nr:GNAT family N-acetyltransferase [Roseovarius faecimaris]QGX99435.1 GNAT family N-acetyltransferase [Roseovarius faecimaris]
MLIVEPGDPRAPDATALLRASHALMLELFPPEDNYALDIEDLVAPDIRFFIAREGKSLLGTGALALRDGYGEVKSMFTAPAARGKGVAAALLRQIEDEARANGLSALKLETGEELAAAVRLYERHGFTRCGIFGDYEPNQSSIYMHKSLRAAS